MLGKLALALLISGVLAYSGTVCIIAEPGSYLETKFYNLLSPYYYVSTSSTLTNTTLLFCDTYIITTASIEADPTKAASQKTLIFFPGARDYLKNYGARVLAAKRTGDATAAIDLGAMLDNETVSEIFYEGDQEYGIVKLFIEPESVFPISNLGEPILKSGEQAIASRTKVGNSDIIYIGFDYSDNLLYGGRRFITGMAKAKIDEAANRSAEQAVVMQEASKREEKAQAGKDMISNIMNSVTLTFAILGVAVFLLWFFILRGAQKSQAALSKI